MKWLNALIQCIKDFFSKKETPTELPEPISDDSMVQIATIYYKFEIEYQNLKAITLAQWILESDWGRSELAQAHNNYAGLKWRGELDVDGAEGVSYEAHDGVDRYASLPSLEAFIKYYWNFLERDIYNGWREHADDEKEFIKFLHQCGYASDPNYVSKVLNLAPSANQLLEDAEENAEFDRRRDDNDLGEDTTPIVVSDGAGDLWYPDRLIDGRVDDLRMRTRGRYRDGYPEGAIVHFTAGRSRNREDGGSRNGRTHKDVGISHVKYAVSKGSFCYFAIDRDGNIYQQFPLDHWGYHAGRSSWPSVSGNVSDNFVGIEILCAGKLDKTDQGYKAWFTRESKGDKLFGDGEVRYSSGEDNIEAGYYHKYSEAQEKALDDLLIWLYQNSPYKNNEKIFKLGNIAGHDEVSPDRKNDPGASLSMTMPEYRKKIQNLV